MSTRKVVSMKSGSRLWFYIIINILVSAATMLVVLLVWEWAHPMPDIAPLSDALSEGNSIGENNDSIQPTTTPPNPLIEDNFQMNIRKVVGAGNLNMEYVEILNQSEGAVDLTGWQLLDEDGNSFEFPTMILESSGALIIHSKPGQDTVIELYWQSETPIWQSGEIVQLLDQNSNLTAAYSIP